jgi:hypothetical protein
VYNQERGEQVSVRLAASGWRVLGETRAPAGYRFSGANADGPVSSVTVKADQLKVRAGKTKRGYTLNEQVQRRIAVRLQLGSGTTWCVDASVRSIDSPSSNDHVNQFTAQPKSAPPATCPLLP